MARKKPAVSKDPRPINYEPVTPSEFRGTWGYLVKASQVNFLLFFMMFHPPAQDGTQKIIIGKLHRYLIELVQAVADGKAGRRQSVSVPPQHGKSYILSVYAVAWLLGRFPGIQIAITGFSNSLVTSFSRKVRDIIQSDLYQTIFPGRVIKDDHNRMDEWELTDGGCLIAKSTGTKLTGRRVDWLVVDDPHSGREEAESKLKRDRVEEWYYADCVSRLSPDAKVFLIATRWHPEDLIGKLTNEEKVADLIVQDAEDQIFEVTNFPAICESKDDPLGREIGEAVFPEVRNLRFLNSQKAQIPAYEWDSQYMGRPRASGSGQVDTSKIVIIEQDELPPDLEKVRGWDLALTEKQTSDYTAGALVCYDPLQDIVYIIDIFRNRGTWVKNRKIIIDKAEKEAEEDGVFRLGIEAVAGFLAPAQDLYSTLLGKVRVRVHNPPKGDKLSRAMPWLVKAEAGRLRLVRGAWNKDFLAELDLFPEGEHDDQVDAVSIAYEALTGKNRNGGIPSGAGRPSRNAHKAAPVSSSKKEAPAPPITQHVQQERRQLLF